MKPTVPSIPPLINVAPPANAPFIRVSANIIALPMTPATSAVKVITPPVASTAPTPWVSLEVMTATRAVTAFVLEQFAPLASVPAENSFPAVKNVSVVAIAFPATPPTRAVIVHTLTLNALAPTNG